MGRWPGGPISWGIGRVWITPLIANTYERGGFAIHGGYYPGSAGCIDITNNDFRFFNVLERYNNLNDIPLTIRYY